MSDSSKIEDAAVQWTSRPSMPFKVVSSGRVTSRSTSSELQPGGWVMTSMRGGTGSG